MSTLAALPSLESLHRQSAKRTREIFSSELDNTLPEDEARRVFDLHFWNIVCWLFRQLADTFSNQNSWWISRLQGASSCIALSARSNRTVTARTGRFYSKNDNCWRYVIFRWKSVLHTNLTHYPDSVDSSTSRMIATIDKTPQAQPSSFTSHSKLSQALQLHKNVRTVKPEYHPPWKLVRVISGHLGWVRSVAVEPGNKWFVSGAGDRVIKVWDLASGELKLSLTGHISTVRGLAVSARHPYLFSCGEDKVCSAFPVIFIQRKNLKSLFL